MRRVLSLRRAVGACADHHSSADFAALHIPTPADAAAADILGSGRSLVVTGNPGDGKTHLLAMLAPRIPSGVHVIRDANEIGRAALVEMLDQAHSGRARIAVAVNRGVLLDVCESEIGRRSWASSLATEVTNPHVTDEVDPDPGNVAVLDLTLRDNLCPTNVGQAISKVTAIALSDWPAPESVAENVRALMDPEVSARVTALLVAVAEAGYRATMRDLLAFVAHMVAGGPQGRVTKYHSNAFVGGQGPLFDRVRELDPLIGPSPFLDEALYAATDEAEDWIRPEPDGMRTPEDLETFVAAKRRALFEHRDGARLIRRPPPDALSRLVRSGDPTRAAIGAINHFFNALDTRDDRLALWVGHRYDTRRPGFLASDREMPATDLEAVIPRLPRPIAAAFGERGPDRLILRLRACPDAARLTIDRDLARALEPGGAAAGHEGVLMKVAAFCDRLSSFAEAGDMVRILRLSDMASEIVTVDAVGCRYLVPREGA